MEPEFSLLCSQQPTTGSHSDSDESILRPYTLISLRSTLVLYFIMLHDSPISPPSFNHRNSILWNVQVMKPIVMYFLQHPVT
jgi:hypothetical protein